MLRLVNPMYFIDQKNPNRAKSYFLRVGTATPAAHVETGVRPPSPVRGGGR